MNPPFRTCRLLTTCLAALACVASAGCAGTRGADESPAVPTLRVVDVSPHHAHPQTLEVAVLLEVTNPRDVPLRLNGVAYTLDIAGAVTTSRSRLPSVVPAGATRQVAVSVPVAWDDLREIAPELARRDVARVPVTLDASVGVPGVPGLNDGRLTARREALFNLRPVLAEAAGDYRVLAAGPFRTFARDLAGDDADASQVPRRLAASLRATEVPDPDAAEVGV